MKWSRRKKRRRRGKKEEEGKEGEEDKEEEEWKENEMGKDKEEDEKQTWKKFLPFLASELWAKNPSAKRGESSSANVALSTPKM